MFVNKKLDLNTYKRMFVLERIKNNYFALLSSDKADGKVYKVSGYGSLDKEGYEHGFLYITKGSSILEHCHNKDIEIYRLIYGCQEVSDSVCLLEESHKIDSVDCDTIIETFKLNKKIIDNNYDLSTLNLFLQRQAVRYLWRIDQLLIKLAYNSSDLCYSSFEDLAYNYQISIDAIEKMNKIYFYQKAYLPFIEVPVKISDIPFIYDDYSYIVEDYWKYEMIDFEHRKSDIGIKQQKVLIRNKKVISD